jgi:hypothetical protein
LPLCGSNKKSRKGAKEDKNQLRHQTIFEMACNNAWQNKKDEEKI